MDNSDEVVPENLTYDREETWNELLDRARESAVTDQEAFNELVDDYFEERLEVGEMDKDQDIHELAAEIKGRWEDFKGDLGI